MAIIKKHASITFDFPRHGVIIGSSTQTRTAQNFNAFIMKKHTGIVDAFLKQACKRA